MTGSGTCRDVCKELGIYCWSSDIHDGSDACDASQFPRACFEFAWIHPPYWRQKLYAADPRDLSRTPTLADFLDRYRLLIENCAGSLVPNGKLAILMGDYSDRYAGFVPLTWHTKRLAFAASLRQFQRRRGQKHHRRPPRRLAAREGPPGHARRLRYPAQQFRLVKGSRAGNQERSTRQSGPDPRRATVDWPEIPISLWPTGQAVTPRLAELCCCAPTLRSCHARRPCLKFGR